jgi:hypothetical protein
MWFRRQHNPKASTPHRTAEVLDSGTGTVVVHLTDRAFPGVVIQGDDLKGLKECVDRIAARAQQIHDEELLLDARVLQAVFHPVFKNYNETCKRHGRGGFKS